ncbi:MAG: hypothetical protein BWY66_00720 [bacterium ADurb.Bin374]|nr:MAG: hypothetical protein BWY66_00720 [bacterium ADurb.Bin374]
MTMERQQTTATSPSADLSALCITLLRGIVHRDDDERLWQSLLSFQNDVRDYLTVLRLELILDESEGYAYLRNRADAGDDTAGKLPQLVTRRQLTFPVSLLIALLRKRLAEFDCGGSGTRLVLSREEIIDMMRLFLPETSNETRLIDQIDAHINKVIDLGFLRRLKTTGEPDHFEVQRIIKAFIDAQWLTGFDERLAAYQAHLGPASTGTDHA